MADSYSFQNRTKDLAAIERAAKQARQSGDTARATKFEAIAKRGRTQVNGMKRAARNGK